MPLVKIKQKYQVTLPASVRKKAGVAVGDLLEPQVRGKTITLTPKMAIDRDIGLALEISSRGASSAHSARPRPPSAPSAARQNEAGVLPAFHPSVQNPLP